MSDPITRAFLPDRPLVMGVKVCENASRRSSIQACGKLRGEMSPIKISQRALPVPRRRTAMFSEKSAKC